MTTNRVFVLDKNHQPLMPTRATRARRLLKKGRAKIVRIYPFTIMLIDRTLEQSVVQPIILKIDPGSQVTGIALIAKFKRGLLLIWAANLIHRGWLIKHRLDKRRAVRRSRRNRKTRYRKARFNNRKRAKGWLPPSLRSRVQNVYNWSQKLIKLIPITSIELETVRFDTQKMMNPEISGALYQQGTLEGYEVREYLLEKWQRKCAYCDKENVPLQIEHIRAKKWGGSNRVSNLTIACEDCNKAKGTQDIRQFLSHDSKRLQKILSQIKKPLRDAAAINSIRYAIGDALRYLELPITFWSGGRTKYNRIQQNYSKDHWIDAACIGESGENVHIAHNYQHLTIKAVGRGNRQMCKMDKYGFPRTRFDKKSGKRVLAKPKGAKRVKGFQTGDMVKAIVPKGKYKGYHIGRVTIRASGSFDIKTKLGKVSANWKYCKLLQRGDGYEYKH